MAAAVHVELEVTVQAPPGRVLKAFFDPDDLAHWWQVVRSVTIPRPLGTYAVEWAPTELRDEVLGRLGGAFHGTVMEYRAGEEFFVADVYWSPPDAEPLGPMSLIVTCTPHAGGCCTTLVVRQSGDVDGVRWRRYFDIMAGGWERALGELKDHLEREPLKGGR